MLILLALDMGYPKIKVNTDQISSIFTVFPKHIWFLCRSIAICLFILLI